MTKVKANNSDFNKNYKVENKYNIRDTILGYFFTSPVIVLVIALLFIPMAYSFYLSFFDTDLIHTKPIFIGITGFLKIFLVKDAVRALRNSFVWTIGVALFQFVVGLVAAILLNKAFRLRWVIRGVIIIPWVIPGVVAGMAWRLFYDAQFGFLNNLLFKLNILHTYIDWLGTPKLAMFSVIVAAIWKGFGFSMLMYLAALQTVPDSLLESAGIDGANASQSFFYITIPYIGSVIRTTLLLTSIWTFNHFEIIYTMTGGGPIRTTHIAPTYIYELAFRNFNFGNASRFSVISFILVGIASIQYIRLIGKREKF